MAKFKVGDRVISKLDTRDYGVIIEIPSKDAPLTYKVRIDSNDGVYDALYDECDLDFDTQSGTVLYEHKDTTNHLADEADKTIEHLLDDKNWQLPNAATMRILTKMADRILAIEKKVGTNHLADERKMVDWEQRRYEIAKEVLPIVYRENLGCVNVGFKKWCAQTAIIISDALIEELKKENPE